MEILCANVEPCPALAERASCMNIYGSVAMIYEWMIGGFESGERKEEVITGVVSLMKKSLQPESIDPSVVSSIMAVWQLRL